MRGRIRDTAFDEYRLRHTVGLMDVEAFVSDLGCVLHDALHAPADLDALRTSARYVESHLRSLQCLIADQLFDRP